LGRLNLKLRKKANKFKPAVMGLVLPITAVATVGRE